MKKERFKSYSEFYENAVIPYKKANVEHQRLNGQLTGGSIRVFAYFTYKGIVWKVDDDTSIDKLDIAYKEYQTGDDPFVIKPTQKNKKDCLVIKSQPAKPKHFYVYYVGLES
ncbi:hypothetical protein G7092_28170 [Mucilaginibacter sp. HC2]|uniref:hypothetical protein n=1 Tax=Mucilaginibacter inviolabilis TaxID=2714892 RepID=UPI00140E4BCF|nr:hypothetical protein [Mucilaginibacter inviolabilis]NHA07709.1 hypothetical protein [Mucilaginibacter inviolabilis]